jgi:eukaryotic-like serine/threonine-protein kinase
MSDSRRDNVQVTDEAVGAKYNASFSVARTRVTAQVLQQIGRYRVAAKLGAGGMGVVYRAYDEKLHRDVAIKLLHSGPEDSGRERILHEARTSSALNHPGICTVYEVEEHGDQSFIVMELIEGHPLSHLIPADGFPLATVHQHGLQIAAALAHAHAKGIVHRDIKPANILVNQGRIKILDFGLAKQVGSQMSERTTESLDTLSSAHGSMAGTLAYMAPEQLRGERATSRSDVWSLGVVLYELATGQRPYTGDTAFTLSSSILSGTLRPLPSRVAAGLRKIVLRCLNSDPSERYQDGGQVHAALEALDVPERSTPASRPSRRTSSHARVRSLAVLPLENLSPGDDDFFADGMTDALITTLAQLRALRVISRTSVMRYKGARQPLPQIAQALNVDAIVEGTVLRSQGRVRIAAQLIHAASDTHLWAKQYESDLRDVLTLQSDVARSIADEIQVQVSPQERTRLARSRPVDPAAYEAFLKGRHFWYRRSPEALARAVELLQQAIGQDPSHALTYAGLADAYASIGWDLFGLAAPSESFPKAKQAARQALELDANCAEAHAALGWTAAGFDWDWESAEREFRHAIELKPQYALVHIWYSHFLRAMDRTEESLGEARRALECDPLGLVLNMHMGWHLHYSREHEKAVEQCQKTLELDPTFILSHIFLGQAKEQLGAFTEAIAAFEKAVELSRRHPTYLADLGHGLAVAGRRTEALSVLDELNTISASGRYVAARSVAEIHIGLGDIDEAFTWLGRALEQRNGWLIHMRENPRYDRLRSDPRYLELVARMNFPAARQNARL